MEFSSNVIYTFPPRALRRWSTQHLQLQHEVDGGVTAVFRLDGTTCGHYPITMHYTVRLGAASDGWMIRQLNVAPAPDDDGYERQCAAASDPEGLRDDLLSERPCLGQPLADAVAWAPETTPAGCLCTAASRAHKWRMVFQTLHYALAAPGD